MAVGVIIVILSATAGCSRTSGAPDNGGLVVDQDELSQIESSRNNLLYEPILAGSASDETAIDTYYIRDAMMKMGRADALPKLDVKKLQVLVKDKSLFDKIDASRAARELYFDRTDIRELKLIPTAADRLGAGLNMLEAVERSDSNSPLVGEVKSLLEDRDFAEARCSSRYLDWRSRSLGIKGSCGSTPLVSEGRGPETLLDILGLVSDGEHLSNKEQETVDNYCNLLRRDSKDSDSMTLAALASIGKHSRGVMRCGDEVTAEALTRLSSSDGLASPPKAIFGNVYTTYEFVRLVDGYKFPSGAATDGLLKGLRSVKGSNSDEGSSGDITDLMAASSLKTIGDDVGGGDDLEVKTRLPEGCITRSNVSRLLPAAIVRRQLGFKNKGLCLRAWRLNNVDYTKPSDDAYWAMVAYAHSDLFGDKGEIDRSMWWRVSDGYLSHFDRYSGPSSVIAVALQSANVFSKLPDSKRKGVAEILNGTKCPRRYLATSLVKNGEGVEGVCSIEAASELRNAGYWSCLLYTSPSPRD